MATVICRPGPNARQSVEQGATSSVGPDFTFNLQNGDPAVGYVVSFYLPEPSPGPGALWSINPPGTYWEGTSDANGIITCPEFIVGSTLGDFDISIYSFIPGMVYDGVPPTQSVIPSTAPAALASMTVTAGSGQTVNTGAVTGSGLQVRCFDQFGAPFAGASITFNAGGSGTFVENGAATVVKVSDANGYATTSAITAGAAGSYNASASGTGAAPVYFSITVADASITCAPASDVQNCVNLSGTGWSNPQNFVVFPAPSPGSTYADKTLFGIVSAGDSMIATVLTAPEIASIPDAAEITSITVQWRQYCQRTSGNPVDTCAMSVRNRDQADAAVTSEQSFSTTAYGAWEDTSKQWTTFSNTGNTPTTKLLGADVKAGKLGYRLRYTGSNPQTADGAVRVTGLGVTICYRSGGGIVSVQAPLHFCEF